eukprot:TRINITY_DN1015_c0_g1_i2.p1 TRINITY_DN1015_c0_g1~~TRINITY_DN1015_c0_g1_i2.p1  ORF type:complete len:363 (+),score=71.55 TRINITY_DN1015_c0_g1_i2:102-1091(+)
MNEDAKQPNKESALVSDEAVQITIASKEKPSSHEDCNETMKNFWTNIQTRKSYEDMVIESEESGMKRTLGALELSLLGIGLIIGTGIFVLTGHAAASNAGPSVVYSFIIAGIVSLFAALCYAEMASMIPISGSAYTYTYATMGELVAWMIGWDLILEYLVGAATVSVGWSGYVVAFIESVLGTTLSTTLTQPPIDIDPISGHFILTGNIINLPAIIIILVCTVVLVFGTGHASWVNTAFVAIKITIILLFIFASIGYINTDNWTPFVPQNTGQFGKFGVSGVFQAATMVFFAYIGFDSVSTTTQECKNPQRDIPIGGKPTPETPQSSRI